MLIANGITVKQYLKLRVAAITSAPAKKPIHLCQNKMLKVEKRSEQWMS